MFPVRVATDKAIPRDEHLEDNSKETERRKKIGCKYKDRNCRKPIQGEENTRYQSHHLVSHVTHTLSIESGSMKSFMTMLEPLILEIHTVTQY